MKTKDSRVLASAVKVALRRAKVDAIAKRRKEFLDKYGSYKELYESIEVSLGRNLITKEAGEAQLQAYTERWHGLEKF